MAEVMSLLGTAVIANGATDSSVLSNPLLASARRIVVVGPATLTAAVTVYGSPLKNALIAAMQPIRKEAASADVLIIAAKENHIENVNVKSIAFKSAAMEGAARSFVVYVVHEV